MKSKNITIPTCRILGVNIAAVNMPWMIEFTKKNIKNLSGEYCCVANVHTTVTAYQDEDYRRIQNGSAITIPDGGPLSSLGRKRGFSNMQRVTGPDYMREIFDISVKEGYRHYFYGSTPETLKKMEENLYRDYPGIQIVGMVSPPFMKEVKVDKETIQKICDAKPDFLWIGLGAPKQECWMAAYHGKVEGFMVGVGAGFDYFAGNIKRAPLWMQKMNLEWLYRLMQEPLRLFKRYFYTNMIFIIEAVIRRK